MWPTIGHTADCLRTLIANMPRRSARLHHTRCVSSATACALTGVSAYTCTQIGHGWCWQQQYEHYSRKSCDDVVQQQAGGRCCWCAMLKLDAAVGVIVTVIINYSS